MEIKNIDELKDRVKTHLKEYLEIQNIEFNKSGRGFKCFNHCDNTASAGLTKDGKGFKCMACGFSGDIFAAAKKLEGKTNFVDLLKYLADMFGEKYETEDYKNRTTKQKVVAEYKYEDFNGKELYKILRYEWTQNGKKKKRFTPCWIDSTGKKHYNYNVSKRVLYNLPQVVKSIEKDATIYFVEGEKCVNIINKLGLVATTISNGANSWADPFKSYYIQALKGAKVVILNDNDKTGQDFAKNVATDIKPLAKSVKIVNLNEDIKLPPKGDIEQWLELGGNKDRLIQLAMKAKEFICAKKNKIDSNSAEWYIINPKTNSVNVNTGILARHLIDNIPAIYTAEKFYIYSNGVYNKTSDLHIGKLIKEKINDKYVKANLVLDTMNLWRYDIFKPESDLNKCPEIINVKNGLLNVNTMEFSQHRPTYLSTTQLNVNYDLNAKCPTFLEYISEAIPKENIVLMQEILGYLLIPETKAQKFFILKGTGGTGKSTFLNTVSNLLGIDNVCNIPWQCLGDRFNTGELFGKLVNIFADVPQTPIEDTGIFKALTGEDVVKGEVKHKNIFYFKNKARLVFSCNSMPENYSDRTDGFYRRFIIIPFNNKPKKIDIDLDKKIAAELDGVFIWALEGLQRLIKNNFTFSENEFTDNELKKYKLQSNNVLQFIKECCMINSNSYYPSGNLYSIYKQFCQHEGLKHVSNPKFKQELLKIKNVEYNGNFRIYNPVNRNNEYKIRAYIGITLTNNCKEIKLTNSTI